MKKILALILCLISIFSLFSGCGQQGDIKVTTFSKAEKTYKRLIKRNEERFLIPDFDNYNNEKYTYEDVSYTFKSSNTNNSLEVFFEGTRLNHIKEGVVGKVKLKGQLLDISELSFSEITGNYYEESENFHVITIDGKPVCKIEIIDVLEYGKNSAVRDVMQRLEIAAGQDNRGINGGIIGYAQEFISYQDYLEFYKKWERYNTSVLFTPDFDKIGWDNNVRLKFSAMYTIWNFEETGFFCESNPPSLTLEIYGNNYVDDSGKPLCVAKVWIRALRFEWLTEDDEISIIEGTDGDYNISVGGDIYVLLSVNKEKLGIDVQDFLNYLVEAFAFK